MLARLSSLARFKIVRLSCLQTLNQKSTGAVENNEDHLEMARMNDYEREMYIERNTGYNGRLLWRMSDYRAYRREAIDLNSLYVTSPSPCYTSQFENKFFIRVHLHGYGDLSTSVLQTEFDSSRMWHRMQITLFCQEDQTKSKVRTFERRPTQKPDHDEEFVKY